MQASRIAAGWVFCAGVAVLCGTIPGRSLADDLVRPSAHRPTVPAYERFFAGKNATSAEAGRLLVNELNCVACHADPSATPRIERPGPNLTGLADRVRSEWVIAYLENPHDVKPGTAMPDALAGRTDAERTVDAEALAHYLLEGRGLVEKAPPAESIAAGERLFHSIGCVACHQPQAAVRGFGEDDDAAPVRPDWLATSYPLGRVS